MSKRFSAKVISDLLELFSMNTAACFMRMRRAIRELWCFTSTAAPYFMDFTRAHWRFLETLIKEADVQVIAPAYRLVPFATYREAFDLIIPLYREYRETHPDKKIILMGDSAGGGPSLALTEFFKEPLIKKGI